jgi:hypothetical protein
LLHERESPVTSICRSGIGHAGKNFAIVGAASPPLARVLAQVFIARWEDKPPHSTLWPCPVI